jgi:cytochrome c oxidase subunit II
VSFLVLCLGLGPTVASCSDAEQGNGGAAVELTEVAARGREVARQNGCTACHSTDGRDAIGPTWAGLYGSEVELDDGTTVTADEEYLTTAIQEPDAQLRAGFRPVMPERPLSDDDLAAVLAYLREIGGG